MSAWTRCVITFYPKIQHEQLRKTGFSPYKYFKNACDNWECRVVCREEDRELRIIVSDSNEVDVVTRRLRKILNEIPKQISYSVWVEGDM